MKKRLLAFIVFINIILCFAVGTAYAKNNESIVILYENDVHCAVEGYSKLAAMKTELKAQYDHVGVVSSGDFVQGGTLGAVSKGEYSVRLMNLVGYDAISPGNHEFDYHISRLSELNELSNTKYISCNFAKIGEENTYFKPYTIVSYGEVDVAYIGIVTPETLIYSMPLQFKDDKGEVIYTFNDSKLHEVVQENIDKAIKDGADYVVALSHIGYDETDIRYDVTDVIENTKGLDVVLDAHSHSVIEEKLVKDKSGKEVLLSSTGTNFEYIGKLTITDGTFDTELIKTETYTNTDAKIDAYIAEINETYSEVGNRKIGESKVSFNTHNEDGVRVIRNGETNLGNLCSDAFRIVKNPDVAFVHGGGLRAPLKAGDITFNDIYSVFPFNDHIVKVEISGQVLLDFLEMGLSAYPAEYGAFPHMSGMTFSVDTSIPSSVQLDENGFFTGVNGDYRVYNVKILDKETGTYKDLELNKNYVLAISDYFCLEYGSGMSMLEGVTIVENEGTLDVEILETYITENLKGVVGEEYGTLDSRITFTEGKVKDESFHMGENAEYAEAVRFVLDNGYMTDVSEEKTNRAMAITALWKLEGCPVANYAMTYEDVEAESWYTEAVRWASATGVVRGYSSKEFAPYDGITREQLASIMWRYAKNENIDVTVGENTNILSYEDVFTAGDYAIPAMQWSCGSGVLTGYSNGTLAPLEVADRIQLASALYRYSQITKSE